MAMVRITGLGRSTILQYRDLVYLYHPSLKQEEEEKELEKQVGKE